jgi:hypothetical protein
MSSSDSSSDSDNDNESSVELDRNQLKLAQMKRNARNKGTTSKLIQKYKNIMTPEERAKSESIKRIDLGLRKVLMLHTAVELSSMCGVLGLKPLDRATVSIDQLIYYCKEGGDSFVESKIVSCVNVMWESAIYEYLKSIGHPLQQLADPKKVLVQVWRKGGFGDISQADFIPHYICRRIVTRFDLDSGHDIMFRQSKLQTMELELKVVEREVYEEHNYTNVLLYLQKLHALRAFETECRDYFINEIEKYRSEEDRCKSNVKLAHEMVAECEARYAITAENLTQQVALYEAAFEDEVLHRYKSRNELNRLNAVVTSFMKEQLERNTTEFHTGDVVPPDTALSMQGLHMCHQDIQKIHNHMQTIRTKVRRDESNFRQQIVSLEATIVDRDNTISELRRALEEKTTEAENILQRFNDAAEEIKYCANKLVRMKVENETIRKQAWDSSLRLAASNQALTDQIGCLRPVVFAGVQTNNRGVIKLCHAINKLMAFVPPEVLSELECNAAMEVEDWASANAKDNIERLVAATTAVKKGKKGKGGKKGGKKSPTKSKSKKLDGGKSMATTSVSGDEKSMKKSASSPTKSVKSPNKKKK